MGYKVNKILVGTQQVRPSGWTPGSNTVAYFPFKEDQLDHSGNGIVISGSGTKSTIGYNFNSQTSINISDCNWFCVWVKLNSASGIGAVGSYYDKKSMGWYLYDQGSNNANIWTFYTSSYAKASVPIPNSRQRNFIGIGYNGTNTVYCLNDTYGTLRAGSGYNFGDYFAILGKSSGLSCNISYSEFIVESSAWTSGKAINYYNSTKSKYGL